MIFCLFPSPPPNPLPTTDGSMVVLGAGIMRSSTAIPAHSNPGQLGAAATAGRCLILVHSPQVFTASLGKCSREGNLSTAAAVSNLGKPGSMCSPVAADQKQLSGAPPPGQLDTATVGKSLPESGRWERERRECLAEHGWEDFYLRNLEIVPCYCSVGTICPGLESWIHP